MFVLCSWRNLHQARISQALYVLRFPTCEKKEFLSQIRLLQACKRTHLE